MTYDPDRFDAEIILDRMGVSTFTAEGMCRLFGCSRTVFYEAKKEGRIPAPFVAGHSNCAALWDREQVIDLLATNFRIFRRNPAKVKKPTKPRPRLGEIPHGTYPGFDAHKRRGVPMCVPCREAKNAYKREWRARQKVAA